jgi:hypothetical protein
MNADDPEPQIAATAPLGLWHVQFRSLKRFSPAPAHIGAGVRGHRSGPNSPRCRYATSAKAVHALDRR